MGNERTKFMEKAGDVFLEIEESCKSEMVDIPELLYNTESTPFLSIFCC